MPSLARTAATMVSTSHAMPSAIISGMPMNTSDRHRQMTQPDRDRDVEVECFSRAVRRERGLVPLHEVHDEWTEDRAERDRGIPTSDERCAIIPQLRSSWDSELDGGFVVFMPFSPRWQTARRPHHRPAGRSGAIDDDLLTRGGFRRPGTKR